MLESLTHLITGSPWTYLLVLAFAALDPLFPLVPSETSVIAAGVLAGAGELSIALVLAAAAAGAFLGDNSSYGFGRTAGRRLTGPLFRGSKGRARERWAERTLATRGGSLIVTARFIPGGRTAATLTAGITRMRWTRFLGFAGIAAVLWATFAAGLGYIGGRVFEDQPWLALTSALTLAAAITVGVELARRIPRTAAC